MPAYDNSAIAAKLDLYADLLEISGADKYRFLAYRKAANSIRAWAEPASDLAAAGRLTEVSGVGPKMAVVVADVISRGSFSELDALAENYPFSLAEVMRVPGVGPKRALALFERLDITSVSQLQDALAQGKVERLGGFGTKTAAKIAESLASYLSRCKRTPLATALPAAQNAVAAIRRLPGVERAEIAGSIRRRTDTVGNIDIVAASDDPLRVIDDVTRLPLVEQTVDRSDRWVTVELHDGMELALRVVPPQSFGVALSHWTGNIAFNLELAKLVEERSVAVQGEQADGAPARTEEELFELLGIPVIAPELREDGEIVRAAASGSLPRLLDIGDVRGDLQTHSTFTDGKTSLAANRAVAAELGYEYFAATDHAYALRMVGGLDLEDLQRQWDEIDELNATRSGQPLILKGIELNIGEEGELDYDDEILVKFDITLASLHSGWDQDEATITERLLRAIRHPLVDVIAHPTGRILGRRDPMRLDMAAVLEACGETGTIMEINSYPDRLDLSAEHIKLGRKYGVRFSLGTDAHAAEQMSYMPYGVGQARRGAVTPSELLNAQPWEIAKTWLKRSRLR